MLARILDFNLGVDIKGVHLRNGNSRSTLRHLFQRSLDLSLSFRVER
jgi:hypothetical protein